MIKKIPLFLLVLISIQTFAGIGKNKDFSIISQNGYSDRIANGKDVILKRFIVIPYIDKKYKDIFETKDEKALLAKFSFILNKNKVNWIDNYIKSCDNSLDINNLIKGLYYFSKKQYAQAIANLDKLENAEFKFLKLLMIADCNCELLRDRKNYKQMIEFYQLAIDNTDNEQNKSIVNNRIRYIKYK